MLISDDCIRTLAAQISRAHQLHEASWSWTLPPPGIGTYCAHGRYGRSVAECAGEACGPGAGPELLALVELVCGGGEVTDWASQANVASP